MPVQTTMTTTPPTGVQKVHIETPAEPMQLSECATAALKNLCSLDCAANTCNGGRNKYFSAAQIFGGIRGSALDKHNALSELLQSRLAETSDTGEYRPTQLGHTTNNTSS